MSAKSRLNEVTKKSEVSAVISLRTRACPLRLCSPHDDQHPSSPSQDAQGQRPPLDLENHHGRDAGRAPFHPGSVSWQSGADPKQPFDDRARR